MNFINFHGLKILGLLFSALLLFPVQNSFCLEKNEPSTSEYIRYQLQAGEGVGNIFRSLGLFPIWRKGGWVDKTYQLNKRLFKKHGKNLPVKAWVVLPVVTLPPSKNYQVKNGVLKFNKGLDKVHAKSPALTPRKSGSQVYIQFEKGALPKDIKDIKSPLFNVYVYNSGEIKVEKAKAPSAPQPVRKPTSKLSAPAPKKPSWFSGRSWYSVGTSYNFYAIEAEDKLNSASAKLVSDTYWGLEAVYGLNLNEDWQSHASLMINGTEFGGTDAVDVEQDSTLQFGIEFGAQRKIGQRLRLLGSLGYLPRNFIKEVVGATTEVVDVHSPSLSLGASYSFFKLLGNELSLFADLTSYFPGTNGDTELETGLGQRFGLKSSFVWRKRHLFEARGFVEQLSQDSNRVTQSDANFGLAVKYTISSGKMGSR